MSVVQLLRQNDPAETRIRILLEDEPTDADLAEALQQNAFVTGITLDLEGVQRTDWDSLLHVIATRANLEKVELHDSATDWQRNAPAGLVCSFFQAIQQNTAIRVGMAASSLQYFYLFGHHGCDMEAAEREQGARFRLAIALQRNTNIESLTLGSLDNIYVSRLSSFILLLFRMFRMQFPVHCISS